MKNKKIVGILSLPYDANYGWALQHFALYKTLDLLGYKPISVCRKWDYVGHRSILYHLKKAIYYSILSRNIYAFYKTHIANRTEVFNSKESLDGLSRYDIDAIVVGSDQVWRTEFTSLVGNNFFLDFVNSKDMTKLSYAASFGVDEWLEDADRTSVVKKLLNDFDYISVREISGVSLCKKEFDLDVDHVIDPTLLLDQNQYNKLIDKDKNYFRKPTLITYILDNDSGKSELVSRISKRLSLQEFSLYPRKKRVWNYFISVDKWLGAFRDCEFVVTDSFHGTVFAIIFNKQFVTIANKKRGLARFTSLLGLFGLSSRLLFVSENINVDELVSNTIDFTSVNELVVKEKQRCLAMLKRTI